MAKKELNINKTSETEEVNQKEKSAEKMDGNPKIADALSIEETAFGEVFPKEELADNTLADKEDIDEAVLDEVEKDSVEGILNDLPESKPKKPYQLKLAAAGKAFDDGIYKIVDWFKMKNNPWKWVILALSVAAIVVGVTVPAVTGTLNGSLLTLVLYLLFPGVMIFACYKVPFLNKIGVVLFCYILGMVVGNVGILPESFITAAKVGGTSMQQDIQDISIMLALPLVLFSIDFKSWLKSAKKGLFCMLLACVSIIVVVMILTFTLGQLADKETNVALGAMSSGVYTGGTPNVAAIRAALGIDSGTFMQFQLYDTVFSLIYIFFLCSGARFFFQKVFRLKPHPYMVQQQKEEAEALERYAQENENPDIVLDKKAEKRRKEELKKKFLEESKEHGSDESIEAYADMVKPNVFRGLLVALLCAGVILGISYLIATVIKNAMGGTPEAESVFMTVLVLLITTLGIATSFIKPIREIRRSFQLGMYIIYLFCFTIATMTDVSLLININWIVLGYVVIAIFGSLLLHAILCKIFKIDSDTFIITSTSAICSPPFVPVVAGALKNKEVLLSGIITGIIGYAIGNYLGIAIGNLIKLF